VATDDVRIDDRRVIPAVEIRVSFARSGGPGGQNVNKVSSKVELRWTPASTAAFAGGELVWLLERLASRLTSDGELLVTSTLTRDQGRNRDDAAEKLAAIVRAALHRPKPRRPTRPSRASKERRLAAKKQRSRVKAVRRGDD